MASSSRHKLPVCLFFPCLSETLTNNSVGHYVTSEYSSKTVNRVNPTYPWAYAFGDTQIIGKSKISQVVEAVIG